MHEAGSWMFEYRFMRMEMGDLREGTDDTDARSVIRDPSTTYMMAPTEMTMDMHMLMAMYGQTDRLSWMVMLNYLDNEMDMLMFMPMMGAFVKADSMKSDGLGDTEVAAMYRLDSANTNDTLLLNVGLSLPTGSVDEEDSDGNLLPYGMQLGSGTFDLKPGVTYSYRMDSWDFGAQASYTMRLNDNDQDYNQGDRLDAQGWAKYGFGQGTTATARLAYSDWDSIDGAAEDITAMQLRMSPTFDPDNYGGNRWDLSVGVSHAFGGGHMLGFEYGQPIAQDLNGVQMKTDSMLSLAYQYMF